jgi:phage tail tape-measure protein
MAAGTIGAALGSFAPVLGNAIGGAIGVGIGAIGGGIAGTFLGEDAVEAFFEPGPADQAKEAAKARAERQEANKAMDEAVRRNRQAKDGAVGDQASLTGARNLNVYVDGTKVHEQDITGLFNPTGTKRLPKDSPISVTAEA